MGENCFQPIPLPKLIICHRHLTFRKQGEELTHSAKVQYCTGMVATTISVLFRVPQAFNSGMKGLIAGKDYKHISVTMRYMTNK